MTDFFQITVPSDEEDKFLYTYGDFHYHRLGITSNVQIPLPDSHEIKGFFIKATLGKK